MVEHLLGLLRVRVARGVNLAVRDVTTSDPYVVLRMGKQVLLPNLFSPVPLSSASFGVSSS